MLLLSLGLGFAKAAVVGPLLESCSEVGRMAGALLRSLQRKEAESRQRRGKTRK